MHAKLPSIQRVDVIMIHFIRLHIYVQYGSGKRTNFFFHFADQFYNPRFSAEWFGVNHSEWKKFTRTYALDILRTFSGPQCTHDIRSVCEYLRVATDYSVQVSLTTQIILSHDDNQTKIVTTGGSRIRLQYPLTQNASDNQLCDWFFYVSAAECQRVWPNNSW